MAATARTLGQAIKYMPQDWKVDSNNLYNQ
jgi:hypothetical protein